MFCDVFFRYYDEPNFRPFVVNCPLDKAGIYAQKIAKQSRVGAVLIEIPANSFPDLGFHECTL